MNLEIRDLALELALTELASGVREVGGKNRGPRVEQYLKGVGLGPGNPWCCAAAIHCYDRACAEFERPLILPRTGRVVWLIQAVNQRYIRPDPVRGALCLHAANVEDDNSDGHVGFVLRYAAGRVESVEANTNADGSREGDRWAVKWRPESYWDLGYIDIAQQGFPLAE